MFHRRKLPMRDYLLVIAIFVNAVKGISAQQLGRDLSMQYKEATGTIRARFTAGSDALCAKKSASWCGYWQRAA